MYDYYLLQSKTIEPLLELKIDRIIKKKKNYYELIITMDEYNDKYLSVKSKNIVKTIISYNVDLLNVIRADDNHLVNMNRDIKIKSNKDYIKGKLLSTLQRKAYNLQIPDSFYESNFFIVFAKRIMNLLYKDRTLGNELEKAELFNSMALIIKKLVEANKLHLFYESDANKIINLYRNNIIIKK